MNCDCLLNYSFTREIKIKNQTEAKVSYPRRRNGEPVTGVLIIGGVDLVHVT